MGTPADLQFMTGKHKGGLLDTQIRGYIFVSGATETPNKLRLHRAMGGSIVAVIA